MKKTVILSLCLLFSFNVLSANDTEDYKAKLKAEANMLLNEVVKRQNEYKLNMMMTLESCKDRAKTDSTLDCKQIRQDMLVKDMDFFEERIHIEEHYTKLLSDINTTKDRKSNLSFVIGPSGDSSLVSGTLLGDEDIKRVRK